MGAEKLTDLFEFYNVETEQCLKSFDPWQLPDKWVRPQSRRKVKPAYEREKKPKTLFEFNDFDSTGLKKQTRGAKFKCLKCEKEVNLEPRRFCVICARLHIVKYGDSFGSNCY